MRHHLAARMLVGLLIGLVLGSAAHFWFAEAPWLTGFVKYVTDPVGKIFLRLLFMLVIPLIVSALSLGVSGLGDFRSLGRIGLKTLAYTVAVSTVAVLLGVMFVNVFKPGAGLSPDLRARLSAQASAAPPPAPAAGSTGVDFLVGLVPNNVIKAMADGDMLAVMVFALFLGIGMSLTRTEPARRLEEALEGLYDVVMRLLGIVLKFAPIGVACLLFTLTARLGLDVIRQLGAYVLVVVGALAVHQFIVYSLTVAWLGGMSPLKFFSAVRPAMVTAFSTASSNATLPTSLMVAEENLKLPSHVSRFVLTLGSTANQNGTALFEGVTVLFLAQFYGVDLTLAQQVSVAFICVLGGIGTAGVPAGSIPVVVMILGMIGVPAEGIGMILGVDRFLDMCRTTLNVTGDLAAAVVVSRGEESQT
ncbi:MAG TPA: dicarboxylate/amino acid:cation symporter [Candidatus Eisenbacteria bacterium]|nr:dicarboxylate/amino acid:cation symporter [Candidatus Eisenbacteria bacterium]